MSELTERFTQHPQVVSTAIDEQEAVLLHLDNQRYYSLNETGWYIWRLLEKAFSIDELVVKLEESYEVEPERARAAITGLLHEFLSENLIRQERVEP